MNIGDPIDYKKNIIAKKYYSLPKSNQEGDIIAKGTSIIKFRTSKNSRNFLIS